MKTSRILAAVLALTATLTCNAALAATTGELLQQGLYAEEVEGNIDSAIKTYGQIIKNSSAPPNHVAQALYRQGMCYMKIKDEASARTVLEKLVAEYSSQTELVEKAKPVLDDLTDFDPAALMPTGTLVYMEFGSPGRQIETILSMLKGTPYENPLAAVAGQPGNNPGQKSPGDILGALLNPSMMAEFKKIRSSAIGVTGMAQDHPEMIAVLYPGKSDALRGLILAGLGMAGKPGEAIEGLQRVDLPEDMAVAYDDKVVIMSRPASQLVWCVKQYKGLISEPTLASSNKSFAKLNKAQRQKNALTVWAKVDEVYAKILKMFPPGQVPPQLLSVNAIVDFGHIDELILTEFVETTGLGSRFDVQFKDGHHCLAYDLIRTPNISKAALEAVPSDAVAVVSFSLNQADSAQSEKVRSKIQNVTGLDLGREIFANVEQVTIFAMPMTGSATNVLLPGQLGLAITSRNPEQTKQVLATLFSTMNPGQQNAQPGRYKVGNKNGQDIYCHMEQVNGTTLLSLDRNIINASVASIKNRKSVTTSGPLSKSVGKLAPTTSKLLLVNAGGAIRLLGPQMKLEGLTDEQIKEWNSSLDQLARAADATTIEILTDEQLNSFTMNQGVNGMPPLNQILGPASQIARISSQARAETTARNLRQQTPALILPATKAPVIDGNEDEAWSRVPRNKLENITSAFGSGEKASQPLSPDDLAADFRAMWDENNLYLLVNVTDDKLVNDTSGEQVVTVQSGSQVVPWWYDDCIELYIDADNAKAEQYGNNDAHYHFDWDKTKPTMGIHNQHGQTNGVVFAMVTSDKGYRTEIKIPWTALALKPSAGATIGLDVHINDDDDGTERDTKITWRDLTDKAWENPRTFGNGALGGLVGWWKFDETQGTTAKDSSGGNHNGTLVGNVKFGKGKIGGAIDLDGAGSFVRIADKSAFDMANEATIACWVNFRTVPAGWTAIVTKGDGAWRLSTVEQNRQPHFAVNDFAQGGDGIFVNSHATFSAGEWHHIVGTYNGNVINLYVDGKLDSSKPWSGGIGRNDFDVLIGENAELKDRCFNGLIDDVRIYNHALPESQIKALAAGQ